MRERTRSHSLRTVTPAHILQPTKSYDEEVERLHVDPAA